MHQRYFQPDQWLTAARNSLKPRLLSTMALAVLAAVVVFGLFKAGGELTFSAILSNFIGGVGALFSLLFGLTALAHQLHCQINGEPVPSSIEAARFAWSRAQSILMLPVWGAGVLLALILAEMLLLSLSNIPALGMLWLALIGVPLLLLNTVIAVALMLGLFNMAARMAIADTDTTSLKRDLWYLIREKLPELLVYNLGGVLVTLFMAALLLSPLWLGYEVTLALIDYAAHEPMVRAFESTGFWGSIAHLIGLVMLGLLLAAVVSVPGVVITHMTLLVHVGLDSEELAAAEKGDAKASAAKGKPAAKVARKRKAQAKKEEAEEEGEPAGDENADDRS